MRLFSSPSQLLYISWKFDESKINNYSSGYDLILHDRELKYFCHRISCPMNILKYMGQRLSVPSHLWRIGRFPRKSHRGRGFARWKLWQSCSKLKNEMLALIIYVVISTVPLIIHKYNFKFTMSDKTTTQIVSNYPSVSTFCLPELTRSPWPNQGINCLYGLPFSMIFWLVKISCTIAIG